MKEKLKNLALAYLPPFLWALLIFYLSSQPILPGPQEFVFNFIFKKMAHIFVYLVLYLLFFRAVNYKQPLTGHRAWIYPLLLTLAYAFTDELHQSFVPGRSATLRDIGYDSLGMGIGFLKIYKYI